MVPYERYCYQLAYRYCFDVPTKEEYRRQYGSNVEEKREPVPIIKNHLSDVTKKVNEKKPKAARKPLTRKQKDKKNEDRRKARAKAREQNPPKRISLEGMTAEEIRLHRNAQARARNAKRKAAGWTYPPKTAEQKKANKAYQKKYHQDRKNDPVYKSRRSLAQKRHYQRKANQTAEIF